jgi:arginyl-tRNA--protein-N-Asp/Glu arginylyltransferase
MFFDDELLKMVVDCKADEPEDVQAIYREVCNKCQDYYKVRINPNEITSKELKVLINKTFRLFDSFVRMAKKHEQPKVKILGNMFEKHPFKDEFMKDKELSDIYNSL